MNLLETMDSLLRNWKKSSLRSALQFEFFRSPMACCCLRPNTQPLQLSAPSDGNSKTGAPIIVFSHAAPGILTLFSIPSLIELLRCFLQIQRLLLPPWMTQPVKNQVVTFPVCQ